MKLNEVIKNLYFTNFLFFVSLIANLMHVLTTILYKKRITLAQKIPINYPLNY